MSERLTELQDRLQSEKGLTFDEGCELIEAQQDEIERLRADLSACADEAGDDSYADVCRERNELRVIVERLRSVLCGAWVGYDLLPYQMGTSEYDAMQWTLTAGGKRLWKLEEEDVRAIEVAEAAAKEADTGI